MSPFGSPLGDLIQDLRHTIEPEDADRALNVAASRGVDPKTCADLRAAWDDLNAPVTVLYASDGMGAA